MLQDKTIVVTGAATGMGAQLADELRERGARVVGLDIAEPTVALDQTVRVDLSDPASIAAAAADVGPHDALVHCAGIPGDVAPAETVFAVNFLGLRALTDAVLPRLRDGGSVTAISSIAGHRWRDRADAYAELLATTDFDEGSAWFRRRADALARPVYALSKEAVWAYTEVLADRLRPRRIRVNSVAPGLTDTRLLTHFTAGMSDDVRDDMDRLAGGALPPAGITSVIRFLIGEDSRWINAQNIVVDGGYLAGVAVRGMAS